MPQTVKHKKLRQVAIKNPTVDAVEPEQEKAFAGKHDGTKTHASSYHAPQFNKDAEDAEENHFTAKNVKVAPYKGRKEVPLDQRGEGTPFSNLAPQQKNHVQEDEQIDEVSSNLLNRYLDKATYKRASAQNQKPMSRATMKYITKRHAGIKQAYKKLDAKEEVEMSTEKEINELSKEKLGSYIVKARQSQDSDLKNKKNFVKRQVGINKASHLAKGE